MSSKKKTIPVTRDFRTDLDGQIGFMTFGEIEGELKLMPHTRFVPTLKVLEFEEKEDGTKIIKKAELVSVSLVFDKKGELCQK